MISRRHIWGRCNAHVIFLGKTQQRTLEFTDCTGMVHIHTLRFEGFPKSQRSRRLDDCFLLGNFFVMKVIDSLNARFTDLPIFNAAKFFSP